MKLIKHLILFILFCVYSNSYSICGRYAQVRYQTSYGWSEVHIVQTIFSTGNELNEITKSHTYSPDSIYAIIFWSQGLCSNIKLNNVSCLKNEITCDRIKSDSIYLHNKDENNLYGYDQYGDLWVICIKNNCDYTLK